MQMTSTQPKINTTQVCSVELSRYLNNSKGFTLVDLLISIAIISILAAVGIHQYTQYKIRAYDAHSKQALHDMNLTCKAFWSMEDTSDKDECDLAKAKEYGFVQNSEVVANVLSTLPENFCASAKHYKSPNTYSSDYVGVVSDNADCGIDLSDELVENTEADRITETAELVENAEANRIAADNKAANIAQTNIDKRARQLCEEATKVNNSNTEQGCLLSWGCWRPAGSSNRGGRGCGYNNRRAQGFCKCNNGFRQPSLMITTDLKGVKVPCSESIPTVEECIKNDGYGKYPPGTLRESAAELIGKKSNEDVPVNCKTAITSKHQKYLCQKNSMADRKELCLNQHYGEGRYHCMGQNLDVPRDEKCEKIENKCIIQTFSSEGYPVNQVPFHLKQCYKRYGTEMAEKCSNYGLNPS